MKFVDIVDGKIFSWITVERRNIVESSTLLHCQSHGTLQRPLYLPVPSRHVKPLLPDRTYQLEMAQYFPPTAKEGPHCRTG